MNADYTEYLSQFLTRERLARFDTVLENRTRHVTVVLEDLFKAQNASACLRSCDCFGIQDVHIIENRHKFELHTEIAQGAAQWLTRTVYNENENNTAPCLSALRSQGYRILATVASPETPSVYDCDVNEKTALVFGGELNGVSDTVRKMADELVTIPMHGFTESLNISAALAITLSNISHRIRQADVDWKLSAAEKRTLRGQWIRRSLRARLHILEKEFQRSRGSLVSDD